MATLNWDHLGFTIDGTPAYPVSGEFHYFRVPPEDWERRMNLFKEAGGNTIATYVPWIVHEPDEGNIVFGDQPSRDLAGFLKTAAKVGLMVILRPGPYQYSELVHNGLPGWLIDDYPELMAKRIDGSNVQGASISYLHPRLLEKARKYYRAFADVVRPFMAENGGPVGMIQLDNELIGIHIWYGSLDYNPETMGFGKADGRYPRWLCKKYEMIERLNDAYGTDFRSFAEVMPIAIPQEANEFEGRRLRDYSDFYLSTIAEYAETLAGWLKEDGLNGPICHNSANPYMNTLFIETVDRLGEGFLLGSDHYYNLNPTWEQNNPTPQYIVKMMMSCELLNEMGMPPTVFELPAGNLSDTPPILPEDLLACYLANTAVGMKGLNYYIYTGGPNFGETGATGAIYDYHAPISAFGEVRDTYGALKEFGLFLQKNGWMQRANRQCSVQCGFTWEESRFQEYGQKVGFTTEQEAWSILEKGLLYPMMAGACHPEMKALTGKLDTTRPLFVICPSCMSAKSQQAIIDFVECGGNVLLMPTLPEFDENGRPLTLLADYVGIHGFERIAHPAAFIEVENAEDTYMATKVYTAVLPKDAKPIAFDHNLKQVVGAEIKRGKGTILWLGTQYSYGMFCQAALFENLAIRLGGKKIVECENRNLFTALWSDGERKMLFVMNPYSSAQKTKIRVFDGDKVIDLGEIQMKYMEIRPIEL